MVRSPASDARRLTIVYALPALLWVILLELVLEYAGLDEQLNNLLTIVVDVLFVVITASLLYIFLRRELNRLHQAQQSLAATNVQLADRETRLNLLFEQSPMGIAVARDGRLDYANPALTAMFGYPDMAAMLAIPLLELMTPSSRERVTQALPDGPPPVSRYEITARRRDGTPFETEVNASRVALADGPSLMIFVADISERKEAEAQIQRQLNRLAALRAIDQAITSSPDLRLTMEVLLVQVTAQLHVDAAAILLFEKPSGALSYAAGRGFRTPIVQPVRVQLGEGFAGRAALERRMLVVPDVRAPGAEFRSGLLPEAEGFVGYACAPLIAQGQLQGVLEVFHRSPLPAEPQWVDFLETLAGQAAIAIDNATLFKDLQQSNLELRLAYDATIEGWSRALDLRDKETEGHSRRVTDLTEQLALSMGMSDAELVHVRRGALLHDIGKMGVPDHILLKPGPLSDDEWASMIRHPAFAYEMLSPIQYLRPALEIPYCHHEKWDGTGYPRGLKGEQIPLAARMFAVVDVWDALRSDRPYRPAWPAEKVRQHIREQAGKHFDPAVAAAFLEMDLPDGDHDRIGVKGSRQRIP